MRASRPVAWLLAFLVASATMAGCSVFRIENERPAWADLVTCEEMEEAECMRRAAAVLEDFRHFTRGMEITGIVVRPIDVQACARRDTMTTCATYSTEEVLQLLRG